MIYRLLASVGVVALAGTATPVILIRCRRSAPWRAENLSRIILHQFNQVWIIVSPGGRGQEWRACWLPSASFGGAASGIGRDGAMIIPARSRA
jgi:hypothetical protein